MIFGDMNWLIKLSSLKSRIAKCSVSSQSEPAISGNQYLSSSVGD
ncbi:Uncharacterised protein [Enterobacter cloacae]|nr:Uncharacterised protein [Enterobacter cloacae]